MLPLQQTDVKDLSLLQTKWKSQLDPVLSNPSTNPGILKNIVLTTGSNVINHKLGQKMQGWVVADKDEPANIFRSSPLNNLTLTLTTDINVTVTLMVF